MSANKKLSALRDYMVFKDIHWVLLLDGDPHMSEYVDEYFKERTYFSEFTGSNGNLLVGREEAYLWTDGRYFEQAEKELAGSKIRLMRMGEKDVPTLLAFVKDILKQKEQFAFDGMVLSANLGIALKEAIEEKGAMCLSDFRTPTHLWENRPSASCNPIWRFSDAEIGESSAEKIASIRKDMKEKKVDFHFLSKLDDIMWITNIRGKDILCNPVAYSYLFLTNEGTHLFLKEPDQLEDLKKEFILHPYDDILDFLSTLEADPKKTILIDRNNVSFRIYELLKEKYTLLEERNPSEYKKAIKNETEITALKSAYLKDSVVMTKFIKQVKERAVKENWDELHAASILDHMRGQVEGYLDLSFPTISAYGPNAAMAHYEADESSKAVLEDGNVYLVDSGGQYFGGTTDVTRTLFLGEVSENIKKDFTRVARGNLNLLHAVFLKGCTGRNLDILARMPLWENFEDYKHGTGHGIGHVLNVHEGPQNISWQKRSTEDVSLEPGMVVSDEPGIYIPNEYGIRTETILLCHKVTENEYGTYYGFEPLTLVPIDLDGILTEEMSLKEREFLNDYHALVYEKISPYLEEDEQIWLKEATRPI